jgi:DNA-3-methyladenine glycosylase II
LTEVFELTPLPPFRLDLTVATLRRRPDNIIDRWDGKTYRRVLVTGDGRLYEIAVSQSGLPDAPCLCVSVSQEKPDAGVKEQVILALEHLLSIYINLDGFYRMAESDDKLSPLVDQFRGFKPPRFQTNFEALVTAIACQQLTLTQGIRLLNGLAELVGPALETETGIFHAFPRPQDVAGIDIEALRKMGFSYQKTRYIAGLAQFIVGKQYDLAAIEALDDQKAVDRLCSLKGVGRWTAEYFLLRGLGRTHIFPADDSGARNHLQRWFSLSETLKYDQVRSVLNRWEGYGGLIYFHLLLKSLAEKGLLAV